MSSPGMIRVGAGLSTDLDAASAAAEAAAEASAGFDGQTPNLVVCFIAREHHDCADEVAEVLSERFPLAAIVGSVTQGVIGADKEFESGPAVSLVAAVFPDTAVVPFSVQFEETGDGEATYRGWPEGLPDDVSVLAMCDPFSFPVAHFLNAVNERNPGWTVIGGVASGVQGPGDARLILGGAVHTDGAVGLALTGRVRVRPLVSQGCRPIGEAAVITRADRNIIFELAGERPIDIIRRIWKQASPRDRSLMQNGLFIGRVVNEYKTDFDRGDFLIRNVAGADPESGFLAVQDIVNVGETVQFHVRDPESADEDLRELIHGVDVRPSAALLFACNGRGTNMFEKPGHDAQAIHEGFGYVPVAGCFANGEIGPVGGRNFWHSFTASVALFVDGAA